MRGFVGATLVAVLVSMTGPGAVAAPPEADRVFSDPTNDGEPLPGIVTAPYADLVGGYISETDDEVAFTLEVVDLPDLSAVEPPEGCLFCHYTSYYWEFSLNPTLDGYVPGCGEAAQGECFTVIAYVGAGPSSGAEFYWGCKPSPPLPLASCRQTNTAPRLSVDPAADTVTVHIKRDGFRNYTGGGTEVLWTDGAVLVEEQRIRGIVAYATSLPSDAADNADMEPYTLGTNRR